AYWAGCAGGALGAAMAVGACATSTTASGGAVSVPPVGGEAAAARSAAEGGAGKPLTGQIARFMPAGVTTLGAATLGDSVYVLGGYTGTPHDYSQTFQSRTFARLDLATRRWQELPSVGPIQSAGLASDAQYVYRVGGMRANNQEG